MRRRVDTERRFAMEGLGKVTTVVLLAALVVAVVIGIRSIPDVRRYAEIRRM
jgi:hypothetical protein